MLLAERLPRIKSDSDFWVDEAIWGHRLYDEQTPWLCFLEFLGVASSENASGRAFVEESFNSLRYTPNRRLHLRNILFNNPFLPSVLEQYKSEEDRWRRWFELMSRAAGGLVDTDFSYLKKRFGSFSEFAEVVKFLQASSIEGDSNKRWSSKFVFPYGPDCLYEDLRVGRTEASNDRRFFARTGELLYLMVCRSGLNCEVFSILSQLGLLESSSNGSSARKWNSLVALLQPEHDAKGKGGASAYLPYSRLPEFTALAEDWSQLAACKMPGYDSVPHFVTLAGLHMLLYYLRRATVEICGEPVKFIIEIVAPKKTALRELSAESYQFNDALSEKAVRAYIADFTKSSEWQQALLDQDSVTAAKELISEYFEWERNLENLTTPDALIEQVLNDVLSRHKQHVKKFHSSWSREIGLASARASRRTRYAPTDNLLKTLVFTCVTRRMEFQEFLVILYEKYGFVIGDKQAESLVSSGGADQEIFSQNAARLEERLARLGLLRRLSDACAYVQNPYFSEPEDASA
ncbi:MAG: hypothetical protein IPK73_18660 [Candidatus Obscuribacter sp.]|nr:hypothetical protein [Candidatus Obscuribacter sp.]